MKKVISVMIAIAVLLSCLTVTAFAKEQNSKITANLAERLDKLPEGEKIETCIWLYYQYDAELIERETFQECGLTAGTCMTLEEVDIYSKTYNRIAGELEAAGNKALIEKSGASDEDIVFCGTMSPLVILNLTKEQIYTISGLKEVQSLDYDDTVLTDEPSEGDLPSEPLDDDERAEKPVAPYLYKQQFTELCSRQMSDAQVLCYKELYYHHDKGGDTDWVLVYGFTNAELPWEIRMIVGNRCATTSGNVPFYTGYGIYDVKEDKFIDASSYRAKDYPDFVRTFDEIGTGRLLGDLDGDDEISIIDATILQRCVAHIRDYPTDDVIELEGGEWDYSLGGKVPAYYSDFDRDGERDITDATMIQRYLAGMV